MEYYPYIFIATKSTLLRAIRILIKNMSISSSSHYGSEDSTTKLLDKCDNPLSEDLSLQFQFCKPKSGDRKEGSCSEADDEETSMQYEEQPTAQQKQLQTQTWNKSSPPAHTSAKSPTASMKQKKKTKKKCRDLSHYNSVPPVESSKFNPKVGLARSSSHTYIPLKSPGSSSASTCLSYVNMNSPLPSKQRTRSSNRLADLSETTNDLDGYQQQQQYSASSMNLRSACRTTPQRSPVTPSSSGSVFKFPPIPSPNSRTKNRRFSFSHSPKSPKSPSSHKSPRVSSSSNFDSMPRSPSIGSTAPSSSAPDCYSSGAEPASHCRRSTTDLTDLWEEGCSSMTSISRPSSPARSRTGSVKSGLAYLASRRGSRDSQVSQFSNEDVAPLNFNNTARGRQRRTSNFLELPVPDHVRPRVCSLPEKPYNPRSGDELYRLRTFSITHKGSVVNCGDSMISRRSRSNTSVNSTASRHSNHSNISGVSPLEGSCCGSSYNNISTDSTGEEIPKYRVVLLGDSGVGKTALVSQFMTSEYMNTYDASLDDEFGEKDVSVLLDGAESEMVFIDHPSSEMSVENSLSTYEPHACVVVYSIVNRSSLRVAEDILNYLWRENFTREKSVIVVGNKADLARARVISTSEGKALAASRGCKFIETSSGIQHNVDELLVGILKQIRLRENRDKKRLKKPPATHGSRASLTFNIAREIFNRICLKDNKSKSCENLHVL